jgi:hypothetical protein
VKIPTCSVIALGTIAIVLFWPPLHRKERRYRLPIEFWFLPLPLFVLNSNVCSCFLGQDFVLVQSMSMHVDLVDRSLLVIWSERGRVMVPSAYQCRDCGSGMFEVHLQGLVHRDNICHVIEQCFNVSGNMMEIPPRSSCWNVSPSMSDVSGPP